MNKKCLGIMVAFMCVAMTGSYASECAIRAGGTGRPIAPRIGIAYAELRGLLEELEGQKKRLGDSKEKEAELEEISVRIDKVHAQLAYLHACGPHASIFG